MGVNRKNIHAEIGVIDKIQYIGQLSKTDNCLFGYCDGEFGEPDVSNTKGKREL